MKKVKIVKQFQNGKQTSFSVPSLSVSLIAALLPDKMVEEMKEKRGPLYEIIAAANRHEDYNATLEVMEKGESVMVTISTEADK